eukprot:gb/GECH01014170.1/.p1 GENE.gb/GECH01014170.1/~~gb/GECH01014170.1/.p1  ORF type:complete len:255 (+),score=48.13 gb/GECH01014170.1/:1-765(+)
MIARSTVSSHSIFSKTNINHTNSLNLQRRSPLCVNNNNFTFSTHIAYFTTNSSTQQTRRFYGSKNDSHFQFQRIQQQQQLKETKLQSNFTLLKQNNILCNFNNHWLPIQRSYGTMATSHMGEFGNEGSTGPQYDVQSENGYNLVLTENTIEHLKHVFQKPEFLGYFLRLSVEGGEGCQGFSYTFSLESEMNSDDVVFEYDSVKVVLDSVSAPLLAGSTVDYVDELVGRSFKITKNPNAAQECGCGVSFTPNTFL